MSREKRTSLSWTNEDNDLIWKYLKKNYFRKQKKMLEHFLTQYDLQTLHNMGIKEKVNKLGIQIYNERKIYISMKEKIIKQFILNFFIIISLITLLVRKATAVL